MIELETMLMQFCLETSGRQNGDRYPVGKGEVFRLLFGGLPQGTAADPACRDDHLQAGGRLEGRKKLGV